MTTFTRVATTTRLYLSRTARLTAWLSHQSTRPEITIPAIIVLLLGIIGAQQALSRPIIVQPLQPVLQPTSSAISTVQDVQTLAQRGPALDRALVAYAAPGGGVLGALERGTRYRIIARSGSDWLQLAIDDGEVWIRSDDLLGAVPDLATAIPTALPPTTESQLVIVPVPPVVEYADQGGEINAVSEEIVVTPLPNVPLQEVPPGAVPVHDASGMVVGYLAPTAEPAANAVRYCTGFGDWRDYDPMYASSPACQP